MGNPDTKDQAMTDFEITARNRVDRLPRRATYDRATICEILDATWLCHVGFVQDGEPVVVPMIHARQGDTLLLHGAPASRLIQHLASGQGVCVSIAIVDGLVLAKSACHHSLNYRSAVCFGRGRLIEGDEEKLQALECLMEHLLPGRWQEVRPPSPQELQGTAIVAIAIEDASAKLRAGPPRDDPEDLGLPVWAGLLPVRQVVEAPIGTGDGGPGASAPDELVAHLTGRT